MNILAATLFTGAALTQSPPTPLAEDLAAIETRIEAVAVLVDLNANDRLEMLFAEEVRLDYTSLFGGAPETITGSELMDRWSSLVPGFDLTRHAISDIEVELHGHTANASASVTGTHWLEGDIWAVSGRYDYELIRLEGEWKVTALTLTATSERGDRSLIGRALARIADEVSAE